MYSKDRSAAETLPRELMKRVCGQSQVLCRLIDQVQRRELAIVPQRGARGAFIFAGPTGVGKTLLAESFAEILFGREKLVRFDCSEFKTLQSYEALLGNRLGDPGRLQQEYARVAEGVYLFDEIEKAHPDFLHLFLQAADAARLTLANGQTLDLRNVYLILTTNLGASAIIGREHLPFTTLEAHVTRAVEKWLRPELRGRFGQPFVFRPLGPDVQRELVEMAVNQLIDWNRQQKRVVTFDPGVLAFLGRKAFSARLGARPLLQVVDELVGNAIKDDLLKGGSGSGKLIVCGNLLKLVS